MYRRAVAITAAILGLAAEAGAQVVPGAPTTNWEQEQAEYTLNVLRSYNTLIDEWRLALTRHQPRQLASVYAGNPRLLVSGYPEVQGRDSIAAFLGRLAEGFTDIRTSLSEFKTSDRLAFASGPLILTHPTGSDPADRVVIGNHVTVLLREGRHWRILAQVLSYSRDST